MLSRLTCSSAHSLFRKPAARPPIRKLKAQARELNDFARHVLCQPGGCEDAFTISKLIGTLKAQRPNAHLVPSHIGGPATVLSQNACQDLSDRIQPDSLKYSTPNTSPEDAQRGLRFFQTIMPHLIESQPINEHHVSVGPGAKQSIQHWCALNIRRDRGDGKGDHVAVLRPTYGPTIPLIKEAGGVPVFYELSDGLDSIIEKLRSDSENGTLQHIYWQLTNPGGVAASQEQAQKVGQIVDDFQLGLLDDSTYPEVKKGNQIHYSPTAFSNILSRDKLTDRHGMVDGSMSKLAGRLPGVRVNVRLTSPLFKDVLTTYLNTTNSHVSNLSLEAFRVSNNYIQDNVSDASQFCEMASRFGTLLDAQVPGFKALPHQTGPFALVDIKTIMDVTNLSEEGIQWWGFLGNKDYILGSLHSQSFGYKEGESIPPFLRLGTLGFNNDTELTTAVQGFKTVFTDLAGMAQFAKDYPALRQTDRGTGHPSDTL